uniref:Uncharacterized protein n=1 Tax=Zea mays TaxID=4577 RepID=A0A804PTA3_MAIZE
MLRCWKRSPLGKPQHSHRCTRSLNAVCKCKMCTSAFSMDGQRWFHCRWWSVDSPLHPHCHRRRCLTRDRLHRSPWMSTWQHHHRHRPLQRQLLIVHHLRRCLWSSRPLLPVVDSPRVPSMLHVDALSSLAIAQMGWPRLPPPTGGPNGPRSGRHVGRLGGEGGEWRDKPRRGRCTAQKVGTRRGSAGEARARRSAPPRRSARARTSPQRGHGEGLTLGDCGRGYATRPRARSDVLAAGTASGQAPGLAAGRARARQRPAHGAAARPGVGGSGQGTCLARSARHSAGAWRGLRGANSLALSDLGQGA